MEDYQILDSMEYHKYYMFNRIYHNTLAFNKSLELFCFYNCILQQIC